MKKKKKQISFENNGFQNSESNRKKDLEVKKKKNDGYTV